MGKRRKAREMAMQVLYYLDISRDISQKSVDLFLDCFQLSAQIDSFFGKLTSGVIDHWERIGTIIERFSNNWKINRMACVDRNILRVAVFELLFCPDIPPKVSINEAIDIAKKYGTEESGAFINGILDSIQHAFANGEINVENIFIPSDEKKITT